ncbi:hypothetical protein KIMH_03780 [Bombiscardovia apis]|uniref:Uncharacterized protein n=1 Tax=Bombiscardovia apis TaxID=2932182 RepID=A0ABN6SDZ7_9BIFI|nr:hypothetical protein KIMH_03780 [Bombiscardovia apis]
MMPAGAAHQGQLSSTKEDGRHEKDNLFRTGIAAGGGLCNGGECGTTFWHFVISNGIGQ